MRDLLLWRRLDPVTPAPVQGDEPTTIDLLRELAAQPLSTRAPLLGRIAQWMTTADAEGRARALEALRGTLGTSAIRHVVAALDDESELVRTSAVAVLATCASQQPARWAHAVFHPRVDVRAKALQQRGPDQVAHYAVHLRADPDPENAARARLAPWPKQGLRLALDMHARGLADAPECAEIVGTMSSNALMAFIQSALRRTPDQTREVAEALRDCRLPEPAPGYDVLDQLLVIADQGGVHAPALAHTLAAAILKQVEPQRRRRLLAALVPALHTGVVPPGWAALAVACEPGLLGVSAIDRAVRREGAEGLALYRTAVGTIAPALVRLLLDADLTRRPDGSLDLSVIAWIGAHLPERRVRSITSRFGYTEVLEAAIADMAGWQAACDGPPDLPGWILKAARRFRGDQLPRLRAGALCTWVTSGSPKRFEELLEDIAPKAAGEVAVQVVHSAEIDELRLTDKAIERLAPALSTRIADSVRVETLLAMLREAADPPSPVALTMMVHVARRIPDGRVGAIAAWPDAELERLVGLADSFRVLRSDKERALAAALKGHASPKLAAWAEGILAQGTVTGDAEPRTYTHARPLLPAERERIALCRAEDLEDALAPALAAPTGGVAAALGERGGAPRPHVWACVALIGSVDPPGEVSAQLDRYDHGEPDFAEAVRRGVLSTWEGNLQIGRLGHAWLHRWEAHAFELLAWLDTNPRHLVEWLRASLGWRGDLGRRVWWEGMASVVVLRSYRAPAQLEPWITDEIVDLLVDNLDTEIGVSAARMLVAMSRVGVLLPTFAMLPKRLEEIAPDTDDATRYQLQRITKIDGLPARGTAARRLVAGDSDFDIQRVRNSADLDMLEATCVAGSPRLVHEAALRLIELEGPGQARLARLLRRRPRVRSLRTLVESIPLWTDDDALAVARACFDAEDATAVERFRIALSFAERGEAGWQDRAIDVVAEPSDHVWFMREDWIALVARVGRLRALSLRLASCDQPHAYRPAAAWILEQEDLDRELRDALRGFIDRGTDRPSNMRQHAAQRLHEHGDAYGLPLVIAAAVEAGPADSPWLFAGAGRSGGHAATIVDTLVDATLLAGDKTWSEKRTLELLRMPKLDPDTRRDALRRLLLSATHGGVRQTVVQLLGPSLERDTKLRRVAQIFAWGVRRGRELTGRVFRVHMTSGRGELGFTRFSAARIFVSPLPVLVGDRYGRDVVEALVLHELGHHMFHAGEASAKVWQRAQNEGLHSLLNLVADEHLERNLRALESEYGDRLKRLAAYAFQHSERETPVDNLLALLLGYACPVLIGRPLGVAYAPNCVVVQRGFLLRELERYGQPFARFVRALRMGLGDRHGDPVLRKALDLFKGGFRHSSMEQLYEITKQLAELYGGSATLAQQFGGHEGLGWDEREGSIHGEGIGDDEVQREVERILDPRQLKAGDKDGPPGKLAINVAPDQQFDPITAIERVPVDPIAHRSVARDVRRAAERLREYLALLGLAMVQARGRLRGRAFDRTRIQAVVIRRDPRMLVAREMKQETDLFIGIVVDCSGSMQIGTSMPKAHRFGVLIAEAVKNLPGVDARFFGFTDRAIYDAGDAKHCAVTSLTPGGGNNDAAALLHVSKVAAASRRKARLLVMISDGLPTECSVDAVRALVHRLTRQGMCCAQVAVRPLAEICFPHHVVLSAEDIETSTRRFGEIVSRLVRRAMGRG